MADTDEDIVEGAEPENEEPSDKDEVKEPRDGEDVVPLKPWQNRKERAEFFKNKNADRKSEEKSDDDEELSPKARKLIDERVAAAVGPLQDELSVRDWFAAHPEDKKFEKQARARYEAWRNVPIAEVMKTLRTPTQEGREQAEEKVRRNSIKGGSGKAKEETVASTMDDYKKVYQNVKRGNRGEALRQLGIKPE